MALGYGLQGRPIGGSRQSAVISMLFSFNNRICDPSLSIFFCIDVLAVIKHYSHNIFSGQHRSVSDASMQVSPRHRRGFDTLTGASFGHSKRGGSFDSVK